MGDPIFDRFYPSLVQYLNNATQQQLAVQAAGANLLDMIGSGTKVILIAHSQGGMMPWLIADAKPDLVRGIIGLEPSGPPFQNQVTDTSPQRAWGVTDAPITYDPPISDPSELVKSVNVSTSNLYANCTLQASGNGTTPRRLYNLLDIPVLVVTSEASYHAQYDWCTVDYLRQAGVGVDYWHLPDLGIHGNGHFMFMEKNSEDVRQVVKTWIERWE